MEDMALRIWKVAKLKGWNIQTLADKLGTSKQTLYTIKAGKTKNPSYEFMQSFKDIGINPEWVKDGVGEMELSASHNTSYETADYLEETIKRIEDNFTRVIEEKDKIIQEYKHLLDIYRTNSVNLGFPEPSTVKPKVVHTSFNFQNLRLP